jgi:hypothetical protein
MKTILLDLDGVLNTYAGEYKEGYIPPIRSEAIKFLEEISKKYEILIFTTRNKRLVKQWLSNNKCIKYISKITNKKEPAYLIVDDRCVTFDGNYNNLLLMINNFKTWYK